MTKPARLQASDFHPKVLRLFDEYVHGAINREAFLQHAAEFATPQLDAIALLDALNPKYASNTQVPEGDPRVTAEHVGFESPLGYGTGRGYLVRPSHPAAGLGLVLVVHENRGLNPHIKDVARRFALEGFVAFAPDALFPLGGYPGEEDPARERFALLDRERTLEDFIAAARFLQRLPAGNGNLAVVGFCYGGAVAHQLATRLPELRASVPFYGISPSPEQAVNVRAALQVHLAATDERINAAWPDYEAALKAANVSYQLFTYPDTQHGFHNDTTPRYDEEAARLAWSRTVQLLRKTLVPGPTSVAVVSPP